MRTCYLRVCLMCLNFSVSTVVLVQRVPGLSRGLKRPGRGADQPPPPKRRGHERVGLYLYSPSGFQWPVIGRSFACTYTVVLDRSGDVIKMNVIFRELYNRTYNK